MQTTLPETDVERLTANLINTLDLQAARYPGYAAGRQPVHVVYGGAHLFRPDTTEKLGRLAISAMDKYVPDVAAFSGVFGGAESEMLNELIYKRVREKLWQEPVEDLRIDFEDGYGIRTDGEEDGHAISSARALAEGLENGSLPPYIGIRIKALTREGQRRAIRTLDLFLTQLVTTTHGQLPANFVVTLPKVVDQEQVITLSEVLKALETKLGLHAESLKLELMIETPQSVFAPDGRIALPALVASAGGRCRGVHFGAYDFAAGCGITSAYQDMLSSTSEFARHIIKVSLAGTGVWIADGATNVLPVPLHRSEDLTADEIQENYDAIRRAWSLHYRHCLHSLSSGFYQSWDLHPAQLVSRYAAVFSFFLKGFDDAAARLRNFVEQAARATMVGDVFDDAATGEGLLNYFTRAIDCGAITTDAAAAATGLSREELEKGTFRGILAARGLITG
jgi:citrate lyase beta subunit